MEGVKVRADMIVRENSPPRGAAIRKAALKIIRAAHKSNLVVDRNPYELAEAARGLALGLMGDPKSECGCTPEGLEIRKALLEGLDLNTSF